MNGTVDSEHYAGVLSSPDSHIMAPNKKTSPCVFYPDQYSVKTPGERRVEKEDQPPAKSGRERDEADRAREDPFRKVLSQSPMLHGLERHLGRPEEVSPGGRHLSAHWYNTSGVNNFPAPSQTPISSPTR